MENIDKISMFCSAADILKLLYRVLLLADSDYYDSVNFGENFGTPNTVKLCAGNTVCFYNQQCIWATAFFEFDTVQWLSCLFSTKFCFGEKYGPLYCMYFSDKNQ